MKTIFIALLLMLPVTAYPTEKLELKTMNTTLRADNVYGVKPIPGTSSYAQLSKDGNKIEAYSFATGKMVQTLFDLNNTIGEKIAKFEGYELSPDGTKMLIQTQTEKIYRHSFKAEFYIYTIKTRKLEKLSEGGKQQVPMFSQDGNLVAFVRDNNLWLVKLLYDNAESQVTKDGKKNEIINGLPDWVCEEEFAQYRSFCFTSDGRKICWIRYEESKVKEYQLQMYKGENPAMEQYAEYPGLYSYKYPKAGQENSTVTVWSYDIQSHRTQKLKVPLKEDDYVPRIIATSHPEQIIAMTLNRHQDDLSIYSVNPSSTEATLLVKDHTKKYTKEMPYNEVIFGASSFVLPSERDGFMHLYVYNMNGQQLRKIGTAGRPVTALYAYDEQTGNVYYQAAELSPLDRQMMVAHKDGKQQRLTQRQGWNSAVFSSDNKYYMLTWSDRNHPYEVTLCTAQTGKQQTSLVNNKTLNETLEKNQWNRRELFTMTTEKGVQLNGWMIKPEGFMEGKKHPVVMYQYSGPGSQSVKDSWGTGSMGQAFDYYLAQEGYIVVCVDGRGTGARGADFEKSVYLNLGKEESEDQVEVAKWLQKQQWVDAQRIGIWGWSYGGFNTLMSMSTGDNVFRCGVAVAPPTSWRYYDSIYTERFMRTPQENKEGYDDNPISRASKLSGELLICHGTADDNVHPQNTYEYSEALVQSDKNFKELFYTNRNHSIYDSTGKTRTHLFRQIVNFFKANL